MCYEEGTLQAYIDRELSGRKRWDIEAHVASCSQCREKLARLEKANSLALQGVSKLAQATDGGRAATEAAWVRLTRDERFGVPKDTKGVFAVFSSKIRIALVPVTVAVAVAIALSFGPVREAAAEFLNIFRVEKVQTITVSPEDIREMEKLAQKGGKANIESLGKFETTGYQEPEAATFAAAKAAAGFDIKEPEIKGYENPQHTIQKGFTSRFTLDVEQANSLIKQFGGTKTLPAELDGKTFTVKVPTAVLATYKDGSNTIVIGQAKSPEFVVPDGIDPAVVRDAMLSLPLPENIKRQLAAVTDWKNTLIIPNVEGSAQDVTVNGAPGVFITPPKNMVDKDVSAEVPADVKAAARNGSALVWQQDGVISGIKGPLTLEQAQAIATQME